MATKTYGDAPRRQSFAERAEAESRKQAQELNRYLFEKMGSGPYDEPITGDPATDQAIREQTAQDMMVGIPEAALTMGSSVAADIPAGWAGMMAASQGSDPVETINAIQDRRTYMPRSEAGKRVMNYLGQMFEPIAEGARAFTDTAIQAGTDRNIPVPGISIPLTVLTAAAETLPTPAKGSRSARRYAQLAERAAAKELADVRAPKSDTIPIPETTEADFANTVLAHEPQAGGRAAVLDNRQAEAVNDVPQGQTRAGRSQRGSVGDPHEVEARVIQQAEAEFKRRSGGFNSGVAVRNNPETGNLEFEDDLMNEQIRQFGENQGYNPDAYLRATALFESKIDTMKANRSAGGGMNFGSRNRQRGSVEDTGGGKKVLQTQAARGAATNAYEGPAYRYEEGFDGGAPPDATAADVLREEQQRGVDIPDDVVAEFEGVPSDQVQWVGRDRDAMFREYGPTEAWAGMVGSADDFADVSKNVQGRRVLYEDEQGVLLDMRSPGSDRVMPSDRVAAAAPADRAREAQLAASQRPTPALQSTVNEYGPNNNVEVTVSAGGREEQFYFPPGTPVEEARRMADQKMREKLGLAVPRNALGNSQRGSIDVESSGVASNVLNTQAKRGAVTNLNRAEEIYGGAPPAHEPNSRRIIDAGLELQEEAMDAWGGKPMELTPENVDIVADNMTAEAAASFNERPHMAGWYKANLDEAMGYASQIFPELANDAKSQAAFKFIMAITSNGQEVGLNAKLTRDYYRRWKQDGKFPIAGSGKERNAMKDSFKTANGYVDQYGWDAFNEFLDTDFTVRELTQMGFKISGENLDTVVKGSAIFGPKIGGGFMQNLRGNYDPPTFDRWWQRTWGRHSGTLIADPWKIGDQIEVFVDLLEDVPAESFKSLGMTKKLALENPEEAARLIHREFAKAGEKGQRIQFTDKDGNFVDTVSKGKTYEVKSLVNNAARNLAKSLDNVVDAPAGGNQREYMRKVILKVRDNLRAQGIQVDTADVQALLWYAEKDLYGRRGANVNTDTVDYATVWKELAEQHAAEGSKNALNN